MSVLMAFTAAVLFGIGTYLVLQRKLSRLIIGLGLIGHGANIVFVTATRRGSPPLIGSGDPDSFAEVAREVSEDYDSAVDGGEIGWVAAYQLDHMREDAVFGLAEVGDISDPIEDASGISIYQLLEASDSREIEEERLEEIRTGGFERWPARSAWHRPARWSATTKGSSRRAPRCCSTRCARGAPSCWSPTPACPACPTPGTGWSRRASPSSCR